VDVGGVPEADRVVVERVAAVFIDLIGKSQKDESGSLQQAKP
jgi:hypothetical protein